MRSEEGRTGILFLAAAGAGALVALGLAGVLTGPGVLAQATPASSRTSDASPNVEVDLPVPEDVPNSCPITVPGDHAFTPASETPEALPSVYDSEWYGTPHLWTNIKRNGEVWRDLPVGADGSLTQKWLWWSDHLSSKHSAEITITADHLDGLAPTIEVRGSGGVSSSPTSPSFGTFMVTGFELPERGCWEITGHYREASLSFVAWVAND